MSKGSDINVSSIEEDIKILKNIIEVYENCSVPEIDMQIDITFRKKEANAIKTVLGNLEILSDMQRSADRELENARKINKEHQKVNGELREKVKELEEENRIFALEGSKIRLSLYIQEKYISREDIKGLINERQFELQQEYKDFKDDIRLNTLQEIYYLGVEGNDK